MADEHIGMSLGISVNDNGVVRANERVSALGKKLSEINSKFSSMKIGKGLPDEINKANAVTASYIRKLGSEGKAYEANREKVKVYQASIDALTKRQKELEQELKDTANASDQNKNAYQRLQIEANDTATQINKLKGSLKQSQEQMNALRPSPLQAIKQKFSETNKEAGKTHSLFKSIFSAQMATSAVTGAFSAVKSGFTSLIQQGKEYNEQQQTMNATWLTLTNDATKGKAMVDQINSMALAAQNSTEMVDGLSQKFYAINKSASQTGQMTKDVLTLQDAFGKTDDAVMNFGTQFSQMMANQKVSAQDMLSFVNVFPEYRMQLLKTYNQQQGTKLSMKQFNDEMSKGKVSSKIAITALHTLADNYKNATGNFTKTLPGMRRVVQANMSRIAGEIQKPFLTMSNPVAAAVSKWTSQKSTMRRFSKLGNTWSRGLNRAMTKALGGNSAATNTAKFLDNALDALNDKSKKLFDWLGDHAKDFGTLVKGVTTLTGEIGKSVWKDFAGIAVNIGKATGLISKDAKGGAIHQLAEGVDNLSKNKTAIKVISDAIVTIATVKGIKAVTNPLISLGSGAVKGYKHIKGLAKSIKNIAGGIKAIKEGKSVLSVLGEGLSKKSGLRGVIGNYFKDISSGAKDSPLKKAKSLGSKIGKKVNSGFNSTVNISKKIGSKIGSAAGKAGKAARNLGKSIAGKVNSGFHSTIDFVKRVGSKIASTAVKAGKAAKNLGKSIASKVNSGFNSAVDFTKGLTGKGTGAGKLNGALQSIRGAKKTGGLTTAGKVTTGLAGAGVALDAGSQFVEAYQNRNSADKRSTNIGKGIGAAIGGGIGLYFGGPLGAAVGSQIGKAAGGWGGKAVNKFTKGWQKNKPPKKFWSLENLGWSTHDMFNKMGKGWNSFWGKRGDDMKAFGKSSSKKFKAGWSGLKSWSSKLGKNASKALKRGWSGMKSWAGKRYKDVKHGWNGFKTWSSKLGKSAAAKLKHGWNGMKSWAGKRYSDVQKGWNGSKKWFGELGSGMVKVFKSAWDGIGDWAHGIWDKVSGGVNSAVKKGQEIWNNITGGGSKSKSVKAHAKGGKMTATHTALVGEEGPELAYKPATSNARILGANGPEITKVKAGEHILNARDTSKVMSGGLGAGLALKGYANGTTKLDRKTKSVTDDYKTMSSKSIRTLNNFARKSRRVWSSVNTNTKRKSSQTRRDSVSQFTKMRKGVHSQMDKMHDGVISLGNSTSKGFGKAMDKMHNYARGAMSDTIDQINKGITGIDKVLGQFGGNTSVIKPVKFATGSNGRLTRNTLAMVNDAQSGPRQEAIVKSSGEIYLPRYKNQILPLEQGDAVLNGTQTQELAHSFGLEHFAKGTGVNEDGLRKIAEKNGADPASSFKSMFSSALKVGKTTLAEGVNQLTGKSTTKMGVPWNNAMWSVINDAIGAATGKGGTREAFLKYAEKTFSGVPYVMGAMSKAASDCSGMVAQALQHFGINIGRSTVDMQNSSGVQYLGKNLSKTVPGDLVIFGHGTGAAGHVGIIKNPKTGTMFNETPPRARVTNISDDMSMGYGYYRVKGLHNASSAKEKAAQPDKGLKALAKRQLGSKAIKWIKDNLGEDLTSSLGGNVAGEGVQRWAGTVKKVLRMLGLSTSSSMVNRVLRQIQTESGGNPKALGGDDGLSDGRAMGLMQVKPPTFAAFKRPGASASDIWNGPENIYAGLNYAKHRYGNSLSYLGNGHGYAKGGNPPVGENVLVGENGPEIAQFKQPVHIYSNEQSQQLVKPKGGKLGSVAPTINININGNISSVSDAMKYGDIIKEKMAEIFYDMFGEEYGTDPSIL